MVKQIVCSCKLASADLTSLLVFTLVQLSLVNFQRLGTAHHFATLVTAVFDGSKMNRRDVIFQMGLITEHL